MAQTVLLVDDELSVLQALVRRLRKEAYQIRTATSAEQARGVFERCTIDLVVSDWRMPGMSGTEFLAKVAAEYPNCIRIMLTGEPSLPVVMGAVNNGEVYRFLTKPYDADALAAIIREALKERETVLLTRGGRQEKSAEAASAWKDHEPDDGHRLNDSVLTHVLECVVTVDHTGRVLEFNPAAERTFRCCRAAILGRPISDLLPSGVLRDYLTGRVTSPSASMGAEGSARDRVEVTAVLSDGTEFPVDVLTVAGRSAGRPILTSFIRDLSTIRTTETALKKAESQLSQIRGLEELRRVTNSVATGFDKLVTSIGGHCEKLLGDPTVLGIARDSVRQIKRAGDRGGALVQQLLTSEAVLKAAQTERSRGAEAGVEVSGAKPAVHSPATKERR
jgi:PAS domain S-box-containing protein